MNSRSGSILGERRKKKRRLIRTLEIGEQAYTIHVYMNEHSDSFKEKFNGLHSQFSQTDKGTAKTNSVQPKNTIKRFFNK